MQPVVQSVAPTPAEPRQAMLVTGVDFGQVAEAFFVDVTGNGLNTIAASYVQVADGEHAIVTVPANIVTGNDYYIELVTINDEVSAEQVVFTVQPISGVVPAPAPTPTPDPLPLPAPGSSVGLDRIRSRTRTELADKPRTFQAQVVGDGLTSYFDLPARHVDTSSLIVTRLDPGEQPVDAVPLVLNTDYSVDAFEGAILLPSPLTDGALLTVTGTKYKFFDNEQLDEFIETSFAQITKGRTFTSATINQWGYRQYTQYPYTYDTVPEVEILPLALLAAIQGLWVLATDASYDIDISEDGASIPRSERYRQIMGQIGALTARFDEIAQNLNIGIKRIEMANLRRVARMTGRLVPLYLEKEYDDHSLPVRILPGVDHGVGEGQEFVDPYYQAGADYGGGFGP
jgi:hypothetical protein